MVRLVFIFLWLQNCWEKSGVWSQTFCDGGACYSLHWDAGSFVRTKEKCEAKHGFLTSMSSEREARSIERLLEISVEVAPRLLHLWIGLHRKVKQCYIAEKPLRGFLWVSGNDRSTYNAWTREPLRTCTHRRCVELVVNYTTRIQLKWNDSTCDPKRNEGFICKYPMCESLKTDIGNVVYKTPNNASQFFPRVPRGTVATILCANGKSVAVKCELQQGRVNWSSTRSLESMCNNCSEVTNNGSCRFGCFQSPRDSFCLCDKGFSVNLQQNQCVPVGDLESGFNVTSGTFPKDSENPTANTVVPTVFVSASPVSTSYLSSPAENPMASLPPTVGRSEPEKREAHSNAPFLIYQVIIGALALMLLVAVAVLIIRERRYRGARKTGNNGLRIEPKSVDTVHQEHDRVHERNVFNGNHYVETPSASENEINVSKENGELSFSVAQ
ncbi:complement component C1q receptor-like [Rhinoraja longicauda]